MSSPTSTTSANSISTTNWKEMKTSQQVGYLRSMIRNTLHQVLVPIEKGTAGELSEETAAMIRDLAEAHRLLAPEPGSSIPPRDKRASGESRVIRQSEGSVRFSSLDGGAD